MDNIQIYIFEPESSNLEKIRKNPFFRKKNIKLIPLGAWHKKETLSFSEGLSGGSKIDESGIFSINCDLLDNLVDDSKVTFIKMDIEGAELNALKGAQQLIQKYKPKLAISVYHKPEDIVEILAYIKQLVPEYRLYLRCYSTTFSETVLYAIL